MKKSLSLLLAFLLLFSLAGCKKADTSKWQSNDVFASVPVYKYADVTFAEFASSMNIKIEKTSYDDFVKYIETLKENGFDYLKVGSAPENYSLNSGSAQWRCTDGKVYLQLIFSEDNSTSFEMFGCNLQIFGYSDPGFLSPESDDKNGGNNKNTETDGQKTNGKND